MFIKFAENTKMNMRTDMLEENNNNIQNNIIGGKFLSMKMDFPV